MTPKRIIQTAKNQGVYLFVDGDSLRFKSVDGAMTPELKKAIRENKQEIIQELAKNKDIAFDILDRLLAGGRSTTMDEWRSKCRSAGVGELDMWRARLEAEASGIVVFGADVNISIKDWHSDYDWRDLEETLKK